MLFLTPTGWALLLVGSAVGALFAAFAFAISVFAVPMLLEERTDALTAMGISMAMVWNNLAGDARPGARSCSALFVLSVADRLRRPDRRLPAARARAPGTPTGRCAGGTTASACSSSPPEAALARHRRSRIKSGTPAHRLHHANAAADAWSGSVWVRENPNTLIL